MVKYKVRWHPLKPFLNQNILCWDLSKKLSASSDPGYTPAPQPTFPDAKFSPCSRLEMEMSAEVLGCCQALIELKIFLRAPNNIYFDLKKVSAEAIALYTSPKSGEITFNLSRF